MTKAVENFIDPYGATINIEILGNVIQNIELIDEITDKDEKKQVLSWLVCQNHQKAIQKLSQQVTLHSSIEAIRQSTTSTDS